MFQRTPNYSVPAHNAPLDPEYEAQIKADYAELPARNRQMHGRLRLEQSAQREIRASRPTTRSASQAFEARWATRRARLPGRLRRPDAERGGQRGRRRVRARARSARSSRTRRLAEKLSPRQVDRLQADLRRHRLLRDLQPAQRAPGRHQPRRRSRRSRRPGCAPAARTTSSTAIVFATGFDAMTGTLLKMDIRGRGGLTLREKWERRSAHLPGPGRARAFRTCSSSPAPAARRC